MKTDFSDGIATTTSIPNNTLKQSDSPREARAIVREAHAKAGPLSGRFFRFIRECMTGIGNAEFEPKDN